MMMATGLWRTHILIGLALLNMAIGLVFISATNTPASRHYRRRNAGQSGA